MKKETYTGSLDGMPTNLKIWRSIVALENRINYILYPASGTIQTELMKVFE